MGDDHDVTVELTLRCYGPARAAAGSEVIHLGTAAPTTVGEVLARLAADPGTPVDLVSLLPHCAVAIDDELVPLDRPVTAAVELALLPPVAGG